MNGAYLRRMDDVLADLRGAIASEDAAQFAQQQALAAYSTAEKASQVARGRREALGHELANLIGDEGRVSV